MQETSGTTLEDATTNNLDLALNGSYTLGASGPQTDDAVDFSGGYGIRSDHANLDLSGDFAVEFWFLKASAPAELQPIVEKLSAGGTTWWSLHVTTAGTIRYDLTHPSGAFVLGYENPEVNRCDGLWHHAVVSRSGSEVRSYIDTDLGRTQSPIPYDFSNGSDLIVANRYDHYGPASYVGKVAHLAIYQHALSQDDIIRHYEGVAREGWGMLI